MENGFDKMVRFPNGEFRNPFVESWETIEKRDMIARLVGLGFGSLSDLDQKDIWALKAIMAERGLLRR